MKPVSTSMDGTSGERSTTKLARSICGLCALPTCLSEASTSAATSSETRIVAFCDRSSSTAARFLSRASSSTPPTRSAAFSWSASQRAASEEAPRSDSTYTEAPLAARLCAASAWMEMKRSACASRARM